MQPLSFNVDRRNTQTTFYHFSDRVNDYSQQYSPVWELAKVYQSKFPNISEQFRNILVDTLVTYVPLNHQNLTMLAAANFIIYDMRTKGISLDVLSSNYSSPMCEPSQESCITDNPNVINCKQQVNAVLDQTNKNTFDAYFNFVSAFIMPDVGLKSPEEMISIRAMYKITLLRYIIFVQSHLNKAMKV